MKSLEILILSGCSKVKKVPEFAEDMKWLSELHLNGTAIKYLPSSIEHLTGLTLLNISHCKNLAGLPCAVFRMESLKEFIVFGCSRLANDDRRRPIWVWVENIFRGLFFLFIYFHVKEFFNGS